VLLVTFTLRITFPP